MDAKTLGWIQIIGGVLALLFSGRVGVYGMKGMMGGYSMMTASSGLAVPILAILFIIVGIHHLAEKHEKTGKKK